MNKIKLTDYRLPIANMGVIFERNSALADAKAIIDERGMLVKYFERTETEIQRDIYSSIKAKNKISDPILLNAYPIRTNPTVKDLMKCGLRDMADMIITTAMQDWIMQGIDPQVAIDMTRCSFEIMAMTYKVKEIGYINQFHDIFLNVTFGLSKK